MTGVKDNDGERPSINNVGHSSSFQRQVVLVCHLQSMQNACQENGWEDCYSYKQHVTERNTTDIGSLQHTVAYGNETSGCYSLSERKG